MWTLLWQGTGGVVIPGSPGAPGVLQDKEVHSQLHQISLYGFSRHAAVHGVDQLGSLPARNPTQRYNAQGGGGTCYAAVQQTNITDVIDLGGWMNSIMKSRSDLIYCELHWPQTSIFIVWVVDNGTTRGQLHTGHGGHRSRKHRICVTEKQKKNKESNTCLFSAENNRHRSKDI